MNTQQTQMIPKETVPEIVRRNVKQVIQILSKQGLQHQHSLINQYVNGQKSQWEFLLPKSKYHRFYLQELNTLIITQTQRQRKTHPIDNQQPIYQKTQQNNNSQFKQQLEQEPQTTLVVGTIESISVGAMCELIKQLKKQNPQPYYPFQNQVYEQELMFNIHNPQIDKKIQPILQMIQNIKNPQKTIPSEQMNDKIATTKIDLLRGQFGTQKDGSLGAWGGKKYQGLGMRDQFTTYRKQVSKSFYQSMPR